MELERLGGTRPKIPLPLLWQKGKENDYYNNKGSLFTLNFHKTLDLH